MKRLDIRQQDVFISWTGKDRELKNQIVEYLRAHGISCLESDHDCSGDFRLWSSEAVGACGIFLLLYTENTLSSTYVPAEIEAYKNYDDYENRIVPVCAGRKLYGQEPWGISEYASAVFFEDSILTEECLQAILRKVESLLVNLLERVYAEATKPQYIKLIPLYQARNAADKEFDFSKLYIPRTLAEMDENYQSIGKVDNPAHFCASEDIIFISGSAGCGKSRYIDQIRMVLEENTMLLSLACHKVAGSGESLFSDMYHEVMRLIGERQFYTQEDFASFLNNRHLLLVLDGLDEISTREGTRSFLAKIEAYYKTNIKNTTLIITSRNKKDADSIAMCGKNVRRFELKKMTARQIQTLVSNLFTLFGSEDKAQGFLEQMQGLDDEIRTNPLLISQLAIIYDNFGTIPKNIVGIYDAISEIILKLDRATEIRDIPESYREMVGTNIAGILKRFCAEQYHLLSRGKEMDSIKIFSHVLKENYGAERKERAEFLVEYLHNRAIMVDGEFYHKMFLEYFAAVNYYEQCFDDYDEIEDEEAIAALFVHCADPYWASVIKIFLEKADGCIDEDTTRELYGILTGQNLSEYSILFEACRNLICHKNMAQLILVADILKKSADGTYPPYGPLFWYIPEYLLYEEAVLALGELKAGKASAENFVKALALVRDVCTIFGQKDTAEEITAKADAVSLYEYAKDALTGIRKALCELFYTGHADYEGNDDIYPRCFNVAEAKSLFMHGCGICGELHTPFEDELSLYNHTSFNVVNGEYCGLISCAYDVTKIENTLSEKSGLKISGLILSPTDETRMKYISFGRRGVRACYLPENIESYDEDWADRMTPAMFCWHGMIDEVTAAKMYCRNQVIVPKECVQIKDAAFRGFLNLEKVILHETVEKIGNEAFAGCINLREINLPSGIKRVEPGAFKDCKSLLQMVIPEGITGIGNSLFQGCTSLRSVSIPESVAIIGSLAFGGCISLMGVELPKQLMEIQPEAFSGCEALEEIEIPDSITVIRSRIFDGCKSLKRLHIPESVENIGGFAFANCSSLTEVVLPQELDALGGTVFCRCVSLKTVKLPANLKEIRGGTFMECEGLTEIIIPPEVETIGGNAFQGCISLRNIELPDKVTTIKSRAFEGCVSLKEIRLPGSVQKFGKNIFIDCSLELKVYGLPTWAKIKDLALQPENVVSTDKRDTVVSESRQVLNVATNAQYKHNRNLVKVLIKKEAAVIEESAFFACASLQELSIENGISEIGAQAFAECYRLWKVFLPNSLIQIGEGAFKYCKSLSRIWLPPNMECLEADLFMKCEGLKSVRLPKNLTTIKSRAFSGCYRLWDVQLPPTVSTLYTSAFANCKSLSELVLPDAVEILASQLFTGCIRLQKITLPKNLKEIRNKVFSGCVGLSSITLPEGLLRIGNRAFVGCTALKEIRIPDSVISMEQAVFRNCSSLKSVHLSRSLTVISEALFECCSELKEVELPDELLSIERLAFKDCVALEQIEIPASVRKIEDGAFSGCTGLKRIAISRRFEGDIVRIFGEIQEEIISYR